MNTLARASLETGVGKNGENTDFRPINRYILETIQDRHTVYNASLIEIANGFSIELIHMILNDLERA